MALNQADFKNYGAVDNASGTSSNVSQKYRRCSLHVAESIHNIQKECLVIMNLSKQLSSLTDSQTVDPAEFSKLKSAMASVKHLISDTTVDVNGLMKLMSSLSPTQKIHVKRLKSDFEAAVQSYGNLQKFLISKTSRPKRRNPFDEFDERRTSSDRQLLLEEEQLQRQKQVEVLRQVQADVEILANRQEIVQELERNVVDINDIMKQLANMVTEQGESINAIENNVESTVVNISSGTEELRKASSYQRTRRRCTIFLLLVAMSALLVLAIVLYIELR
ncbi:t-SNARE domain-containing protein 1-like isoform X1 [Artemia franciscana]